MAKHFMLDNRTAYQRIKDWIIALFSKRKVPKVEFTRLMSSQERENRKVFSNSQSTGTIREMLKESERIFRRKRVRPAPPVKAADQNSCSRYHCD